MNINDSEKKEYIKWAYRLFFDRECENKNVIYHHAKVVPNNTKDFRNFFLGTTEFKNNNIKLDKPISFCIPTVNRYEDVLRLILSAENNTIKPNYYIIIDNGYNRHTTNLYNFLYNRINLKKIRIVMPSDQWCCSKSWNYFLDNIEDIIIISNDDIVLGEFDIESFIKEFYTSDNSLLVNGCISSFSLFLIKKNLLNIVGYFDENFSPVYWEDIDYSLRCGILGNKIQKVDGINCQHIHNGYMKSLNKNEAQNFEKLRNKNDDYFVNKWGSKSPPYYNKPKLESKYTGHYNIKEIAIL